MIRPGICLVPFGNPTVDHRWLQPKPTVKSWQALRSIGFTDVRMQFQVGGDSTTHEAPVSEHPGEWDVSLFRAFATPAFVAGVKINADYCVSEPIPKHQDAAWHEEAAFRFATEFGHMIDSYSFGNEPGADAKAYEGEDGPTAERDYMRDVYFPTLCLPFVRGIRRAVIGAWIIGCDADSAAIQSRYTEVADQPRYSIRGINICDEEAIHPYGEVVDQSYSTLAAFKAMRSHRPWGITEIDSHEPSKLYDFTSRVFANPDGCQRFYFLFEGNEAEFFEPIADGRYSSFYSPNPVVNASGRRYAEIFAKANGPVDPIRTTMPIPGRRPGKGRR